MELIYAIDVIDYYEYLETIEVAEVYAQEVIDELEKAGLDYEISIYQYYVPDWHYSR